MKSASVKQAHLIACCTCQDNVPETVHSSHHVFKGAFWVLSYFCTVLGLPSPRMAKFSIPVVSFCARVRSDISSRKFVEERSCVSTSAWTVLTLVDPLSAKAFWK